MPRSIAREYAQLPWWNKEKKCKPSCSRSINRMPMHSSSVSKGNQIYEWPQTSAILNYRLLQHLGKWPDKTLHSSNCKGREVGLSATPGWMALWTSYLHELISAFNIAFKQLFTCSFHSRFLPVSKMSRSLLSTNGHTPLTSLRSFRPFRTQQYVQHRNYKKRQGICMALVRSPTFISLESKLPSTLVLQPLD